jgi:hypothetical protein
MTHEFLSSKLDVRGLHRGRRAATLRADPDRRSQVTVIRPEGLAAYACACYRVDYERLISLVC